MKLSNFNVLVGLEVERLYEGRAILTMTVEDHHRHIHNVIHGGVIAALADTAGAIAAYTVAPEGIELATIELKTIICFPSRRAMLRPKVRFCVRAGILWLSSAMSEITRVHWRRRR
jgi:hypothetical protein